MTAFLSPRCVSGRPERRYSLKYRLRTMKDICSMSTWWNTPNDFNSVTHNVISTAVEQRFIPGKRCTSVSINSWNSREWSVIIYSMKNTFLATRNLETDSTELWVEAWRGLWNKSDSLTVRVAQRLTRKNDRDFEYIWRNLLSDMLCHILWPVAVRYPSIYMYIYLFIYLLMRNYFSQNSSRERNNLTPQRCKRVIRNSIFSANTSMPFIRSENTDQWCFDVYTRANRNAAAAVMGVSVFWPVSSQSWCLNCPRRRG